MVNTGQWFCSPELHVLACHIFVHPDHALVAQESAHTRESPCYRLSSLPSNLPNLERRRLDLAADEVGRVFAKLGPDLVRKLRRDGSDT
jgi:hypothetical protein